MKKKAIEKIPYQTAEKASKKYTHVAVVFTREICGISHLFVEIYENKKGSLSVPYIRMVFTKHDWGFYFPPNDHWRACGIEETYIEQRKVYISEKAMDETWDFTKERGQGERKNNLWTSDLRYLIHKIKNERRERQRETRQKRLDERIANLPQEPVSLKEWADDRLFYRAHRLYYKRHGRYADVYCTACKKDYTRATQPGEGFEAQFEPVIPTPKEGKQGTCQLCHAVGIYRAKGRKISINAPEQLRKYFFIAQKYKKTGVVSRYYLAEKGFNLIVNEQYEEAREEIAITEISREFFEEDKKPQRDFHVYNGWEGKNEWIDCNLQGYGGIEIFDGAIHPESYKNLKGTILQYSEAKEFSKRYNSFNLFQYMERYREYPQIEVFLKMGLYKIVRNMVLGECGIIADKTAKKPADFFGIYPERVKSLIKKEGDIQYLKVYRKEKRLDKRFTERQVEAVKVCQLEQYLNADIFNYTGLDRLINNIERYAGCKAVESDCTTQELHLEVVARKYIDYIKMRKEQGYDLHNSVYLFPRNLDIAHDALLEEINKDKIEKRKAEIALRYPDIEKNYRKLCYRYSCQTEDYLIRPARSAVEIMREGRILHHCVGSDNYLDKHNRGVSYILFLRRRTKPEEPYITIEIKGEHIVQWYGAYDKKPDATIIAELLRQYTKKLKTRIDQQALAAAV